MVFYGGRVAGEWLWMGCAEVANLLQEVGEGLHLVASGVFLRWRGLQLPCTLMQKSQGGGRPGLFFGV